MSKAGFALCLLALAGEARADESTVAWHFASRPTLTFAGKISGGEIQEPPAPSVFTAGGDRLTDLSAALRETAGAGEETWLVWNETRHLLVAHGSTSTILTVEAGSRFGMQGGVAAITVEWYRDVDPAAIPPGAKPVARADLKVSGGMAAGGNGVAGHVVLPGAGAISHIDFRGRACIASEAAALTSVNLVLGWSESTQEKTFRWALDSGVVFDGRIKDPLVLASVPSPSGSVWTLLATCRQQSVDGIPAEEARWIERNGKAVAIPFHGGPRSREADEKAVVGGVELICRAAPVVRSVMKEMSEMPSGASEPADIRAEGAAPERLPAMTGLVYPSGLWPGVTGPLLDAKALLRSQGVPLQDGDFAGYNPSMWLVYLAVSNPVALDIMESIFPNESPGIPVQDSVTFRTTEPAGGRTIVLGVGSGRMAAATCLQKGKEIARFMAAPMTNMENGKQASCDIDYALRFQWPKAGPVFDAKGKIAAPEGVETPVLDLNSPNSKSGLTVQVEMAKSSNPGAP